MQYYGWLAVPTYAFRGRDASPQTFPCYPLDSAWFPVFISSGDCLR